MNKKVEFQNCTIAIDNEIYYALPKELVSFVKEQQKEIERLTAESTEWESKCYKYQDIIYELEKWLEGKQELTCGCGITRDYIYAYENVLDYLKDLKEGVNSE